MPDHIQCCVQAGKALRGARSAVGISQWELAERMGTSQGRVSRIECGRVNISLAYLRRAAGALKKRLTIRLCDRSETSSC